MTKTESILKFLRTTISPLARLYNPCMEVQVLVARDEGKRIKGEYGGRVWRGWQDPETREVWKSFRIPWNADTDAVYKDTELKFDLAKHVEGIGMTGWDWKNRQSLWVGFDFDSITNHKEGLADETLDELIIKTSKIPWVTLLRSTSGKGIHLYLFFDEPIPTKTHTEHAAIARSLLSILTIETGFNFKASVDCVGSVLWCYHRKQEGTEGLTYIKEGSPFPSKKVPSNWKEHIGVCSRSKKKTHSGNKNIESFSSAMRSFFLDDKHLEILKWFTSETNPLFDWWWDTDYNMLVCHTKDLKKCHNELKLRGVFETNSSGSSDQNCFAFPIKNGSFIVRRHGSRVAEARTWIIDEGGWTRCLYNAEPTIHDACVINGALENEKGEYVFSSCEKTAEAVNLLGQRFSYPAQFTKRQVYLKTKGTKLIFKIEIQKNDTDVEGFLRDKKYWVKVLNHKEEHEEVSSQDTLVRHVIAEGVEAGWYIKINEDWIYQNKSNVMSVLISQMCGYKRTEIEQMVGKSILDPWILVNKPFQDEYLGNRQWNKDAVQLGVKPTQGKIEYWWNMLDHLGSGLDEVVAENEWCNLNGISTGSDYLFAWISSMIQRPDQPLPYLFFFSPEQNTGKSSFHEALSLLFKGKTGVVRADKALTDKSGFNAELAHAVLCVVEETDLSEEKYAANRIKDWVTGRTISIRALYKNAYDTNNTTHWMQFDNNAKACLVMSGDTRITMIHIQPLSKDIPKEIFMNTLKDEAPAFLYELLQYSIPSPEGRLTLPCLETEIKTEIMQDNYDPLQEFIHEEVKQVVGHLTSYDEFYTLFKLWLVKNHPSQQNKWTKRQTSMKFPRTRLLCKGQIGSDNKIHIGNITFDHSAKDKLYKYSLLEKRLIKTNM